MGYQPNINCIHFHEQRCSHPIAQRRLRANLPCILGNLSDDRCSACKYQVEHQRPVPTKNMLPPPGNLRGKKRPRQGQ